MRAGLSDPADNKFISAGFEKRNILSSDKAGIGIGYAETPARKKKRKSWYTEEGCM
ncbi:hypothetical protein [Persephonella sp.]